MRDRKLTGQWAGFSFQNGHLITPEGRGIAPADLQWLSLTCTIAREWTTMMAEERARKPPRRPASVIYLRDALRRRREKRSSAVDGAGSADRARVVRQLRGPRGPRRG
ncbi:DUF3653 domain-containing protein [Xanthomonas campestris]|uniref:DUF3653 domain-containing protein n=1 Tax=Xanthomonas campestris TaxID=339 RepID=UPI001E395DD3|nr:DUF3653 domain-containing protein [Xanthomonas campestris]MCC4603691.1 phage protein [Xanthomonas campestris pv. parthenii]